MNRMHIQGDRWLPDETPFSVDMPQLWGEWYCDSEVGTLRAVLMHRPGPELDLISPASYHDYLFDAPIDHGRFRDQCDHLLAVYEEHGVAVHLVENQRQDRPNALYVRDLVTMTPEGAIIARPAIRQRRGEERAVMQTLANLGVPIIKTVNGNGIFEGSNVMWLDRHTCLLGTSSRTNAAGANQVEEELHNLGVSQILRVSVPYGQIHIDGFISLVDYHKAVISPWLISWDLRRQLLDLGFTLIEDTNLDEVGRLGTNFVALQPGQVIMPEGFPETRALLESSGVEVIPIEFDEVLRGGGAVHCMTAFLKRDPVGA
ncbi:MAG: amidinotransferase [Sulfobacillus benefaciens]|uniref:Amidinotransferase n=1 Tax=Sulfobacillus benefaciens TaxID=453960 RepID=A0A2T2XDX6_9FIRM|nr:MAG: amidinotransferase [Sulfobacillus benefaciens]